MPKIYDCFTFFNELQLLELRLEELYPVVDHFVLVEATRTFQKKEKPLYYQENKERFKKYHDKIIHVVVDTYPHFFTRFRVPTPWDYDNGQKEFIFEGLKNARPDDVVIVSDIDEIPLASKVKEYAFQPGIKVFEQFLCFYYLNNICTYLHDGRDKNKEGFGFWRGTVMVSFEKIKTIKATRLFRDLPSNKATIIPRSGWHFSYMGGVDMIIKKIESWAHTEFNNDQIKNRDYILESIYSGKSIFEPHTRFKLVDVETSDLPYPSALKNNWESYRSLLLQPRENV